MNELIKINYETEQPTVSARDLHEVLIDPKAVYVLLAKDGTVKVGVTSNVKRGCTYTFQNKREVRETKHDWMMTAITGLGWLAVLIGAAAVPEDAVKGVAVAAVGLVVMAIGSQYIDRREEDETG